MIYRTDGYSLVDDCPINDDGTKIGSIKCTECFNKVYHNSKDKELICKVILEDCDENQKNKKES